MGKGTENMENFDPPRDKLGKRGRPKKTKSTEDYLSFDEESNNSEDDRNNLMKMKKEREATQK